MNYKTMKALIKSQQGELDAVLMYRALARATENDCHRALLLKMAADEGRHAAVLRSYTGINLKPSKTLARIAPIALKIVGRRVFYFFVAIGEISAVPKYRKMSRRFSMLKSVSCDEGRHAKYAMKISKNVG